METKDVIISGSIHHACSKLGITHEVYSTHVKSQNIVEDEKSIDMSYLAGEMKKYEADDTIVFVDGIQRNLFVIHVMKRFE